MTWIVTTPLKTGLGLLSDWHWVPGSCRVCQKALGYPNPPEKRGITALLPLDSALHTRCGAWTTAIIGLHALAEDSAGVREDIEESERRGGEKGDIIRGMVGTRPERMKATSIIT
ncbi:hypothetical protein AAG906_003018 [Vitis piasezkii]